MDVTKHGAPGESRAGEYTPEAVNITKTQIGREQFHPARGAATPGGQPRREAR